MYAEEGRAFVKAAERAAEDGAPVSSALFESLPRFVCMACSQE